MSCEDLSHLKKYASRDSPAYPANECCGQEMPGNPEGKKADRMYKSVPDKNGVCHWRIVPLKATRAKATKKTSAKKTSAKAKSAKKTSAKKTSAKKTSAKSESEGESTSALAALAALGSAKPKAGKKRKTSAKAKVAKSSGTKRKRSAKADGPKVKRARSAYIFYAMDQHKTFPSDMSIGERGKAIGAAWKKLSVAQKQPYEAKAAKDKLRSAEERAALQTK